MNVSLQCLIRMFQGYSGFFKIRKKKESVIVPINQNKKKKEEDRYNTRKFLNF